MASRGGQANVLLVCVFFCTKHTNTKTHFKLELNRRVATFAFILLVVSARVVSERVVSAECVCQGGISRKIYGVTTAPVQVAVMPLAYSIILTGVASVQSRRWCDAADVCSHTLGRLN